MSLEGCPCIVSGLGSGEVAQGEFAGQKATLSVEFYTPGSNTEPGTVNYFVNRTSYNYFAPSYYNITTLRIDSIPGTLTVRRSGNLALISGGARITYEDIMSIIVQSQGAFTLMVIDGTPDFFRIASIPDNKDSRLTCDSGIVQVTSGDFAVNP